MTSPTAAKRKRIIKQLEAGIEGAEGILAIDYYDYSQDGETKRERHQLVWRNVITTLSGAKRYEEGQLRKQMEANNG